MSQTSDYPPSIIFIIACQIELIPKKDQILQLKHSIKNPILFWAFEFFETYPIFQT